jgi:putative phosphoribosyl transferase
LFVRKLGAPGHEELGLGAIVDGANPQIVLNEEIVRQIAPSADYMRAETRRQLAEIDRRRQRYMGDRLPAQIAGRTVIVVDDGIATGGTMKAALRALHKSGARWIVLAVPVAPPEIIAEMRAECDEIVCLRQPVPFGAVGAHYVNFDQTSDEEVVQLMESARAV